jgi:hypothetical protein
VSGDARGWGIELKPQVTDWMRTLSPGDRERFLGALMEVARTGPTLGRPYSDSIRGSRHHNMKELRPFGTNIRALFAFDQRRTAVMLVAGDKTNNWKGWYRTHVPQADASFTQHQRSIGTGGRGGGSRGAER